MSKIVIALGGNALGKNPSEQLSLLKDVAKIIVAIGNQYNLDSYFHTQEKASSEYQLPH